MVYGGLLVAGGIRPRVVGIATLLHRDEGISLAIASAALAIVIVIAGWWAGLEPPGKESDIGAVEASQHVRAEQDAYVAGRDLIINQQGSSSHDRSVVAPVSICITICGILAFFLYWHASSQRPASQGHPAAISSKSPSPINHEERMLGQLVAGDDYTKLHDIIGTDPDAHFMIGHYTVFQFNQRWEYIDLLVSSGTVVSLGVYARSAALKAVLYAGGYPVSLNGPSIARQTAKDGVPVDSIANCGTGGDWPAWFFEDFSLSEADRAAFFALGWSESPVAIRGTAAATLKVPDAVCADRNGVPPECFNEESMFTANQTLLGCMEKNGTLAQIDKLSPSAIVIDEPYQMPMHQLLSVVPSTSG